MKKKIRWIIGTVFTLLSVVIILYFTTSLHQQLSGQADDLSFISLKTCIKSVKTNKIHRYLYLAFEGIVIVCIWCVVMIDNRPYKSRLIAITPDIETPVRAGQNQHGSARWLTEKEKNTIFDIAKLNEDKDEIQALLQQSEEEINTYIKEEQAITRKEKTQKETDETNKIIRKANNTPIKTALKEEEKTIIKNGGIVLGLAKKNGQEHIYYISEDTHLLCIGATRSGKSRTMVLQTLGLLGLAGESMVISDIKGELYDYTAPFLKRLGYNVICLDFKNTNKSHRHNFLQPIIEAINDGDLPKAIEETWDLTSALVPENSKGEKIWSNGEASVIASGIMAVVWDNRNPSRQQFQNMANVYHFIANMCKTVNKVMPINLYIDKIDDKHPAKGLLAMSEIAPRETQGSFYTSALTTLRLFTNPNIANMTAQSDFKIEDVGEKKTAIFMILPDAKSTYYSLASLFVSQLYMSLSDVADQHGGRLNRRVNFILDEFGNFTKIHDFANKLTVAGGKGIRFNLFVQGFDQLITKYDKEIANTIKGNCKTWAYLATKDSATKDELSKTLGKYTVSTYSLSSSHKKYTSPSSGHNINLTGRELLTSEEIGRIKRPYTLITADHHPAIMTSPDLSQWLFNRLFGLGDEEHNLKVRMWREERRDERKHKDVELWGIWNYYIDRIKQKYKEKQK